MSNNKDLEATDVTINRQRGIGGSDVSAIMGDSPFLSRWDLLRQKAGIIERDFKGNEFTAFGHAIEPKIRDYINKTRDANFEPDYVEDTVGGGKSYYYHSDGCDSKLETILEIKSTSVIAKPGEEREVYKHYYEQLLYGMWLHGYQKGILAVYERPEDMSEEFDPWRLQTFEVNMAQWQLVMDRIRDALIEFKADWAWLEEHKVMSESELPSRAYYLSTVDSNCEIDGIMLPVSWFLRNEKAIAEVAKAAKTELCRQMLEHGVRNLSFDDIGIKVTCVPRGEDKEVPEFDAAAFAKDHHDLYEKYMKTKVRKGKAAYVRVTRVAEGEEA